MGIATEIRACELTPDLLRDRIAAHGALVLRDAFDASLLAEIRSELDRLLDGLSVSNQQDEQAKLGHISARRFRAYTRGRLTFYDPLDRFDFRGMAADAFSRHFRESSATHCRRIDPTQHKRQLWDAPIAFHVDAEFHRDWTQTLNFWTPLDPCGRDAPGLEVALAGPERTREYLGFDPGRKANGNAELVRNQHKFSRVAFDPERIGKEFAVHAPILEPGDALVFTNFTLHRTYVRPDMTKPRMSIEIRLDSAPPAQWMKAALSSIRDRLMR